MSYRTLMSAPVTTINGHVLSTAEARTLDAVLDYMRAHSGDSAWSANCSPKGDGRTVPVLEIFPNRNNRDNAARRTITRMADFGVLRACEIVYEAGSLKGFPL